MRLSNATKCGHADVQAVVALWIIEGIQAFVFVNVIIDTGCAHVSISISHDDDEESEIGNLLCIETSFM